MTYQLVIWCRYGVDIDYSHIYTTLFKSNYKILFEIWIMVKSNMIGQFMVAMAPIQNIQSMIMCVVLPHTFVPSMTSMGCLTFEL